jgi:hypothetical protein
MNGFDMEKEVVYDIDGLTVTKTTLIRNGEIVGINWLTKKGDNVISSDFIKPLWLEREIKLNNLVD